MHTLKPPAAKRRVLYPVVNVALNVTASDKLAWQERKAEPFIFSPLYSGSAMLRREQDQGEERRGAYVSSQIYGGNEPDFAMEGRGLSLATAMSISGAAASPNMGYHSSAATAFLMTLFNVRLGAWMPNPGRCDTLKQDIARSDPKNSLRAMLRELGGMSDDRGLDIYLSDGGHFENLGLYEMIRRRCRYIVLSDAGADPDRRFEALGNAVRKIKIDLGIDIHFEELRISSRTRPIHPQYAWALGEILYPEGKGHLLYVKPSLFGDLPVDVHSYAEASATFPHETTADQFFSEIAVRKLPAARRLFHGRACQEDRRAGQPHRPLRRRSGILRCGRGRASQGKGRRRGKADAKHAEARHQLIGIRRAPAGGKLIPIGLMIGRRPCPATASAANLRGARRCPRLRDDRRSR